MMENQRGFREIDHTADWTLEVWAPSFEGVCVEAIHGMASMSGVDMTDAGEKRRLCIEGKDREQKLVGLLSEVLYLQQADRFGARRCEVTDAPDGALTAHLVGGPVEDVDKEIKAVTWYDLEVVATSDGVQCRITFDV
jgi:SHS2 domain-containing protein